jgi:hypothetical protein
MKSLFTFIFIITALQFSFGQEAYFSTGRNFTTYDYTNSQGESNDNVKSSSGAFYELGLSFDVADKLQIATGITLNEFNATGGNYVNNYSWNTNYLGIKGLAKYAMFSSSGSKIGGNSYTTGDYAFYFNLGVNVSHIIDGKQKINGETFDLISNDEFKGLFVQPIIGLDAKYYITNTIAFGLGYNYSKSYGITNSTPQKLNFNNSQLQFNLLMSLN